MKPDVVGTIMWIVLLLIKWLLYLQEPKLYEEVASVEEMTEVVSTALDEYNNTHKNRMNLVVFR